MFSRQSMFSLRSQRIHNQRKQENFMNDKPYEIRTVKHLEEINTIASIMRLSLKAQEEMSQRRYRAIFRQDKCDSFLGYDRY